MSHRQELSTSPSYCCCCEPEFDRALIIIESRHDALDSPSTPCIRVPSPLAWGRNNVRELRAQRRHVLRHGGRGAILTASLFRTAVPSGYLLRTAACYKYLVPVPDTWYVWSPYNTKKMKCFYIEPRIRCYTRINISTGKLKNEVTNRRGKKGPFLNLKKSCNNQRP